MIAGQHGLVERHAVEAGRDGSLRNSLGGGFILEFVEPRRKVAGAARGGQCRRARQAQHSAERKHLDQETVGCRCHHCRIRFPCDVVIVQRKMLASTAAKTWLALRFRGPQAGNDDCHRRRIPPHRRKSQTAGQRLTGDLVSMLFPERPMRYPLRRHGNRLAGKSAAGLRSR